MQILAFYALLIAICAALEGCSFASYTRTEGVNEIQVVGIEIGTDRALDGFTYSSDKVQLSLTNNQVTQTKGFKAAVEGVVSAILKTVAPLP